MTEILPQYAEDGAEELSFFNSWRGEIPQIIDNAEDTGQIDTPIAITGSLIPLVLTDVEFTEMLSALYVGAEFAYPEKYLQIIWYLLRAVQLPVLMPEDCIEFPSYSVFIGYAPMNPFVEPDEIPEGYLVPPFIQITAENIDDWPGYELNDVIVPLDAITFDADWFEDLDGQLPTVTIRLTGEGKAELNLLTIPQGGLAVITLDNPPNIADILIGIITGADNIVDTNKDIVSLPPETADSFIFPVEIEGEGDHIIYIVFLPIIDDSFIPIRFGGGFRSVELLGFVEKPEMGITDIRYDYAGGQTMIQAMVSGVWEDKINLYDAVDDAVNPVQLINFFNNGTNQIILQQETTGGGGFQDVAEIDLSHFAEDYEVAAVAEAADMAQETADNAEALATAAQETADGAVSVNTAQNDRLDTIEEAIDALDARIDALENVSMWIHEWDFTTDDFGIVPTNATYGASGFVHTQGSGDVLLQNMQTGALANQIDTIEVGYSFQSAVTGAPTNVPEQRLNAVSPYGKIRFSSSGGVGEGFVRVPNNPSSNMELGVQDFGDYTITYVRFYGRGTNPF